MKPPEIDERDFEKIVEELRALAPYYVPELDVSEDKGGGVALLKIFANMLKLVIDRLNRVPEKNFAAFLDMLGIQLRPAQPARAPVAFYLSNGAKENVLIPERSQASAEEIVFETEKNMVASPSKLVKAYSISVDKDRIFASPPNVVPGEITTSFSTTLTFDVMDGEKKLFLDDVSGLKEEDILKIEDKGYLFSWDDVPMDSREKLLSFHELLRYLKDDLDISWTENAEIRKSDDGRTIRIFKDENSAEITMDENKEKATLKISDGRTQDLKVKNENDKLNIYYEGIEYAMVSEVSETRVDIMDKLLSNHNKGTVVIKVTTFELFEGKNRQEHILYLGHEDLFNIRGKVGIKLEIKDKLEDDNLLMWEYYACKDLDTKEETWERFGSIKWVDKSLILTKDSAAEIKETEINEIKSRWIRCKVAESKISDAEDISITIKVGVQSLPELPRNWAWEEFTDPDDVMNFMNGTKPYEYPVRDARVCCVWKDKDAEYYVFYQRGDAATPARNWAWEEFTDPDDVMNFMNGTKPYEYPVRDARVCCVWKDKDAEYYYYVFYQRGDAATPARNWALKKFTDPGDVMNFMNGADPYKYPVRNARVCCVWKDGYVEYNVFYQREGILPDMAFYNDVPLDLTLALHPFGKRPRIFDTFHIGCRDAFSKKGASITLFFSLTRKHDIPVIRIHGVGEKFADKLEAANIHTAEELLRYTPQHLADKILKTKKIKTVVNILEAAKKAFYDKTLQTEEEDEEEEKEEFSSQDGQEELTLSWEYWNGEGWIIIKDLDDKTDRFLETEERTATFICPSDIEMTKVNGQENYWVRVRIVSGDYGKELFYDGENWVPGQINPPLISRITINYASEPTDLEHCLTYNNLEFKDVTEESKTGKKTFEPFQPLDDEHQTLYLGFDKKIEKGPISIFFSLDEQKIPVKIMPRIEWYYYSRDKKWVRLEVLDGTRNLTRTGTVEFIVPTEFAKTSKFGDELYWLKAVDIEDKIQTSLKVRGIYLNTTFAIQAESIEDEIIGSSDGSADQKFRFTKIPVIEEELWVNEKGTLLEEEKKKLEEEMGKDYVLEKKDETGKTREVWVRWRAVEDFFDSAQASRHYVVDRTTGEVTFGDRMHGMVPPVGRENIRATYRVGGGARGNVGALEISAMKTSISYVDRVTNPEAAGGGADIEILEDAMERGPWVVKHRNRAVTVEDFEWLAKQASRDVARVKCTQNTTKREDGSVTVIIVPESEEEKPAPSLELKNVVEKYLLEHCSNVVSLNVEEPEYIEVSVTADMYPISIDAAPLAEKEALKRLKEFLHPLTGGENGKGWEFGRLVCLSDIYTLLEGVVEIDHVENVTRTPETMISNALICSGEHQITIRFKGAI